MNKPRFNIGDKVRVLNTDKGARYTDTIGKIGTIENISYGPDSDYGVRIAGMVNGCKSGLFWYEERYLEPVSTVTLALYTSDPIPDIATIAASPVPELQPYTPYKKLSSYIANDVNATSEIYRRFISTFNVETTKGYRTDKKLRKKIDTITTKVTTSEGSVEVVCDASEYSQWFGAMVGCAKIMSKKSPEYKIFYQIAIECWDSEIISIPILINMADAACGGSFDRAYNKWVSEEVKKDEESRKCKYCGKILNTIEDLERHEKWHVENKKRKHQQYLIRKEAKRRLAEDAWESAVQAEMGSIENS